MHVTRTTLALVLLATAACERARPLPPVTTDLVLYLPLDGEVRDATGRVALGDIREASTLPAEDRYGRAGRALAFARESAVELRVGPEVQQWPLTWSFWMRADRTPHQLVFPISKTLHPSGDGVGLFWEEGELVSVYTTHAYQQYCRYDGVFPADGRWHHVAMTQDAERMRVYLDGKEVGTHDWRGARDQVQNGEPLRLGLTPSFHPDTRPVGFEGALDDVAIYRRALSPTEIAELFRAVP